MSERVYGPEPRGPFRRKIFRNRRWEWDAEYNEIANRNARVDLRRAFPQEAGDAPPRDNRFADAVEAFGGQDLRIVFADAVAEPPKWPSLWERMVALIAKVRST